MNNTGKRIEGAAEEVGGKIKGSVGSLIGNQQMEAEGKAKELQGRANRRPPRQPSASRAPSRRSPARSRRARASSSTTSR